MNPDLFLCQTRSLCAECRWSGPRGCTLLASLEAAMIAPPGPRPPDGDGPAGAFAWSDAGLVYDGGSVFA